MNLLTFLSLSIILSARPVYSNLPCPLIIAINFWTEAVPVKAWATTTHPPMKGCFLISIRDRPLSSNDPAYLNQF